MPLNQSVEFSDRFFRQPPVAALQLNPFEELALPFLRGAVLDVGCGMGNLAFAATARGCVVPALDASAAAIEHIRSRAAAEGWPQVILADLRRHPIEHDYDCVVSIGLLMFFDCVTALRVLADLQARVRPGGHAVVNLLVQGTTYADMFDPQQHCLLAPTALQEHFAGWHIEYARLRDFAVPQGGPKRFATVIAAKPLTEHSAAQVRESGKTGVCHQWSRSVRKADQVLMVGRHGPGIAVPRCKSCFHFAGEAASQLTGE